MTGKSVPGEGSRFKALEKTIEKSGKSKKTAKAIAASVGRKKYGSEDMSQASAAGRTGKVHRMTKGGK
jgi:hypothetical protein